jgi:hypothetical protein
MQLMIASILVLVHWTLFATDIIRNNFFPFQIIFGKAYYTDNNGTYTYENYSYSCSNTGQCAQELCLAAQVGRTNRVILMPVTTGNNCYLPNDIFIYIMSSLLIVETLATIWCIVRYKCRQYDPEILVSYPTLCGDGFLCPGLMMWIYGIVSTIVIVFGPISLVTMIVVKDLILIIPMALRLVTFVLLLNSIKYDETTHTDDLPNEM